MDQAVKFVELFNEIKSAVHENAKAKGFWHCGTGVEASGMKLALVHSEISECLESLRKSDPLDDKIPEFTGQEAELADAVIRIMDYAAAHKLRVAEALIAKVAFNTTRPFMHGKTC